MSLHFRSRPDPASNDDGLGRLAGLVALGGLLLLACRSCNRTRLRRRGARSTAAPVAENRWEEEGGRPRTGDTSD
jgi:hypothetical protein